MFSRRPLCPCLGRPNVDGDQSKDRGSLPGRPHRHGGRSLCQGSRSEHVEEAQGGKQRRGGDAHDSQVKAAAVETQPGSRRAQQQQDLFHIPLPRSRSFGNVRPGPISNLPLKTYKTQMTVLKDESTVFLLILSVDLLQRGLYCAM